MRDITLKEMHALMVMRAMRADVLEHYIQHGEELAAEFPRRVGMRLATVEGEAVEREAVQSAEVNLTVENIGRVISEQRLKSFLS